VSVSVSVSVSVFRTRCRWSIPAGKVRSGMVYGMVYGVLDVVRHGFRGAYGSCTLSEAVVPGFVPCCPPLLSVPAPRILKVCPPTSFLLTTGPADAAPPARLPVPPGWSCLLSAFDNLLILLFFVSSCALHSLGPTASAPSASEGVYVEAQGDQDWRVGAAPTATAGAGSPAGGVSGWMGLATAMKSGPRARRPRGGEMSGSQPPERFSEDEQVQHARVAGSADVALVPDTTRGTPTSPSLLSQSSSLASRRTSTKRGGEG